MASTGRLPQSKSGRASHLIVKVDEAEKECGSARSEFPESDSRDGVGRTTIAWPSLIVRTGLVVSLLGLLFRCWGHVRAEDALVLTLLATIIRRPSRCVAAFASITLSLLALPPVLLPTYWVAFTPLVLMWRLASDRPPLRAARCAIEAFAIAFTSGWLSTSFIRAAVPTYGWLAHAGACVMFGCQLIPSALSICWLRHQAAIVAAIGSTAVAVACEMLQAHYGVSWSITSVSLPAAASPVAQWAHLITQFGVSGIFCFCSLLLLPDRSTNGRLNWTSSILAVSAAGAAVLGGHLLKPHLHPAPLPFAVMLVQPHCRPEENVRFQPWRTLDSLTQAGLRMEGPVDLIVWPEDALTPSESDSPSSDNTAQSDVSLQRLVKSVVPSYHAAVLAGVVLSRRTSVVKYGYAVPEYRVYNCACLARVDGTVSCQEKLCPIPLKESLPHWLDMPWLRKGVLEWFGLEAPFCQGRHLTLLTFKDRFGRTFNVVAPICYESFLPWLPHYRDDTHADAIIHLCYDGFFADYRECAALQQWACQYRAIETRKWNLLCSTWSGSAVIDPTGEIRAQCGGMPDLVRTDRIVGLPETSKRLTR